MIPLGDDNPTTRTPVATIALLIAIAAAWLFFQGAGFDGEQLAASICNWGLVAGEVTHRAPVGMAVPLGEGLACVVDDEATNWLTPLTSMFLHGGWMHLLGNALFLWVFGDNVEDAMGHGRFLAFYLLCGLVAAAGQVLADPVSPVPLVGASGAISGVMGAYLVMHPHARIRMLFIFIIFFKVFRIPAWIVLLYWFGLQLLSVVSQVGDGGGGGVAFMAHVSGFVGGMVLARPFAMQWGRTP